MGVWCLYEGSDYLRVAFNRGNTVVTFCVIPILFDISISHFMQLAIDREVLKIIAKTREEIHILRESYAARKASRKTSLQFTESSKSRTAFKVPQQGFRQSHRAKPSLIVREDYGSSVLQKEPGTVHYRYGYAALQKEE